MICYYYVHAKGGETCAYCEGIFYVGESVIKTDIPSVYYCIEPCAVIRYRKAEEEGEVVVVYSEYVEPIEKKKQSFCSML